MKNKFVNFLMIIITLLMTTILGIFGILIYEEISGTDALEQVENFVSTYNTLFNDMEDTNKITTPGIIESTSNDIFNEIEDTPNSQMQTINANNANDKFFYSQLEDEAKVIYQALYNNKEQMKSGTAKIELGTYFTDLLKGQGGDELLGRYYQSAVESYLYDNPDIFYISANKLYLNMEKITKRGKTTYNVFINSGSEPNYFSGEYQTEEQVRVAIQKVEQARNEILSMRTGNTYKDIKMVHDYLIDNIEYDTTIAKDNIYNIYGALINHQCVCEGYAESFKYILDELGIPCVLIIGQATNSQGATENHAWNYVQIDGIWYAVDVTWDDPVIIGNGYVGNDTRYKFFLKGENRMNKDHKPNTKFTENGKTYTYPSLSMNDY